ncbi:uncharacterized protein LACBIDRAFT_314233 [Laccaria bicolor S238N-H82]|uniref:Predicted protein n=1 Tax=Laccaria bicolor (strain S238N-H82 / ATCC MYA-4686) TaxID=486041 RepID=B0D1V9_LACBS|nr:uncharacterized protein LACBIDRAFT_314233 [Laccaria bicolor S238N-H82]EDR12059.1 predicted protein [Laccaria bicolor S238N-H82]|eukprot:XP_001877956.1 predicted protein [Laccaria bicolor S238N-H82]
MGGRAEIPNPRLFGVLHVTSSTDWNSQLPLTSPQRHLNLVIYPDPSPLQAILFRRWRRSWLGRQIPRTVKVGVVVGGNRTVVM